MPYGTCGAFLNVISRAGAARKSMLRSRTQLILPSAGAKRHPSGGNARRKTYDRRWVKPPQEGVVGEADKAVPPTGAVAS